MEGSSNQAPNQGQSVMSPSTPSSYAVNINRKKTRKWVEAKVQNYDGDDWGAPESEDEPESPEMPLPARRPAPVGGTRLPSESRIPGAGRAPQAPILQQPQAPTKPAYERPEVGISAAIDVPVLSEKNEPENGAPVPTASQLPEAKQHEAPRVHGDEAIPDPREDLAKNGKRVSVSPQLPNVARLSAFGADMFSSGSELSLPREPAVQEEREPSPAPLSTGPTTAPVAEPERASASDVSQKNDQDGVPLAAEPESLSTNSSNKVSSEEPEHVRTGTDTATLPPLHIPSPHEPSTVSAKSTEPTSGKPTSGILPTEPLHPRKPEYTPSDYEPQPLGSHQTHDSTTSSPLKESDVLSDEIMRSLTPGGLSPHREHPDEKREPPSSATGRPSSSALSAYDDYWNETGDTDDGIQRKPTLGAMPEVPAAGATSMDTKVPEPTSSPPPVADPAPAYQSVRVSQPPAYEASPASHQFAPMSPESSQPGSDAALRRRFSWEAEEARAQQTAATPKDTTPTAAAPQPIVQDSPVPVQAGTGQPDANPASPTIKIVSGDPSISHQVSLASSSRAPGGPPSPVSDLSNRDATPLAGNGPGQGASPLDVQSPSAARDLATGDAHAPAGGGVSSQPTLTFREIMNMSSPQDRIAKYEESRSIFANQESGLSNWLAALKAEHAEHANANGSYSGAMAAPPSPANASAAPGPTPSAQQPYYQQYLNANANTPSAGSAPGGSTRSRLAGFPMQAQQAAGSAFGGSGNQIGTKGKELMHSAGKMGKGLFSKGKSKLRGTGDKGEHSPPPVDRNPEQPPHQGPSKSDRRMSWAFSLGPKSRENTSFHAVPSSGAAGADTSSAGGDRRLSLNTEPPRLAEPPRLSPLDAGGQGDLWLGGSSAAPTATTATTTNNERKDTGNEPGSLTHTDVAPAPAPGLRNPPPPNGNEQVAGGPGQGPDPDPERLPAVEARQKPLSEADWVVIPRQATAAQDIVAGSDARVAPCLSPKSVAGQAAAEGRRIGTGMASQSQSDARPDAQRHSSFKGLPPLRRNSSFGLTALITADDQQQDESAAPGRDSPAQGGPIAQPQQAPAHQPQPQPHPQTQPYQYQNGTIAHQRPDGASPQPIEEASHRSVGVDSNATLIGQDSTNRTGRSSISISKEPMRSYQHPQGQQPVSADPNTGAPRQATSQPQQSPSQPDASPQPPSGWQLEESHLSEPLQVARRRAGTGSSQQQVTYGSLEKETGGTLPMSPLFPASGPQQQQQLPTSSPQPPRGRSSDVPPSSARRYPDLFRPANQQQRDRADSGGQPMSPPTQGPYQTVSQIDPAQHPSRAGLEGSPAPSEGRRKSSNIFKGLGDRLSGTKSNERRSSLVEQSTPPNGQQPAGFHASVQAQHPSEEPKKKRSSFLPNLKQRPSHDAVNEPHTGDQHRPATQETMQPPERAQTGTPQSEKKRSLLGSAGGRMSAAQQKYIPGGFPGINRASTSDVAVDASSTTGNDTSSMGPPKKRFSGFADKAAGFAGKLHRPSQEHAKPSTSHSSRSSMSQLPQPPGAVSHQSLPPPHSRPRDRSSTVESTGSQTMVPPSGPDAGGDRQGRRGSFTGAINNLWGSNRSSSKSRQPEQPGPYAGPRSSLHGDGQVLMGPPDSSQGPAGRGSSMDAGSRASRQFLAQTLPARPSPLAQQSAAQGPSSPIEYQPSHAPQDQAADGNNGRARSPVDPPSNGLIGQQYQQRNTVQDEVSRASMVSPVGSVTTEQGHRASVTEDSVKRSLSQRTVEDPQATPTSPVPRLPTPHASALLSSMAPPSGPRQPSATTLLAEDAAPNETLVQDGRVSGYQGHARSNSSQPVSMQFDRNISLRKPVPQATSIPSRGGTGTPVHMEAAPPSAHDGSPAPNRVVSALVQQPGSQPQSPMGFRPSPPPAGHQSSPTPAQQATKLSPPLGGPGPTNRPSDAPRQSDSRQSLGQTLPQQHFQQPRQPQGPSQAPQQLYFQRGQQGAPQQHQFSNQGPYGQPGGPGPQQPGYPPQTQRVQGPIRQGQVPSQQQQGIPPQSSPSPGQQPVQPTTGSESKLKGWKARMSAMGQPSPQNGQPKPAQSQPGKPSTGGKLLGALKKVAKPSENPPPPPPKTGQPPQQSQWRPSPAQPTQGVPTSAQHPFAPHNAYGQYTQQGRGQPGPPPNAGPPQFYQQPQQYRQGGQHVQQQQHAPNPLPAQPGQAHYMTPQHRPPQPSQTPHHGYGQQMAMHHTQQAMHRPSEPQYDHVPIPQGYSAVHGEGMAVPTNYHVSRGPMQPQGHFSPQEKYLQGHQPQLQHQQMLYQGQAPAPASHAFNEPPAAPYGRQVPVQQIGQTQQTGMHRDTLVPRQVQSQDQCRHSAVTSTPPDHGSFNLPIQGGITPSTTTPARTPDEVPFEAVQQRDSLQRPPALRHDTIMTDGGRSVESGVMGGSGQRLLPPGQPQFGHHLQPQSSNRSLNTQEPSREGSQISSTTPGNTTEITRPVSISPDADIVDQHGRNAKDLNVDVAKSNKVDEENIYDATPRLHQNKTGASDNSVSGSGTSGHKVPVTSVKAAEQAKRDDPPMMELEDTAGARMRTLRLNSQEEKIFYDPEGDVPKMSATSYPGQEWNPYGEPEFGDWKEE